MATAKLKKLRKIIFLIILVGALLGGTYALYLWNMPHIDVQAQKVDYSLEASSLVNEYLLDDKKANDKYLSSEGDSKIFVVKGVVKSKTTDMNNQIVVLLQGESDKAGVKCVFMTATNKNAETLKVGELASIKGIIRSGAKYDNDLELFENVLLEKCDVASE